MKLKPITTLVQMVFMDCIPSLQRPGTTFQNQGNDCITVVNPETKLPPSVVDTAVDKLTTGPNRYYSNATGTSHFFLSAEDDLHRCTSGGPGFQWDRMGEVSADPDSVPKLFEALIQVLSDSLEIDRMDSFHSIDLKSSWVALWKWSNMWQTVLVAKSSSGHSSFRQNKHELFVGNPAMLEAYFTEASGMDDPERIETFIQPDPVMSMYNRETQKWILSTGSDAKRYNVSHEQFLNIKNITANRLTFIRAFTTYARPGFDLQLEFSTNGFFFYSGQNVVFYEKANPGLPCVVTLSKLRNTMRTSAGINTNGTAWKSTLRKALHAQCIENIDHQQVLGIRGPILTCR